MTTQSPLTPQRLVELAERVERETGSNNELDVLVEIALFEPDGAFASIRANVAGTKTICTTPLGKHRTFWARDYTISRPNRVQAAAALRARAALATAPPVTADPSPAAGCAPTFASSDSDNYHWTFFGILNAQGDFWTPLPFHDEASALAHLRKSAIGQYASMLQTHRVVPVRVRLDQLLSPPETDRHAG